MTDPKQAGPHRNAADVDHEESDVNVRAIVKFGAGLFVLAAVIHLAVWVLFRAYEAREIRNNPPQPLAVDASRIPPAPTLQEAPRVELQELRARESAVLNSYGWVDRDAGIVRIPIAEAMRLTVERGLPAREPSGGAP
jgi:hypothetical protein